MDERLIDYIRTKVSPHLLDRPDNLAIAIATGSLTDGPYAVASRRPVPAAVLSWRTFGAAYFAPLWIRKPPEDEWRPNLMEGLLDRLSDSDLPASPDGLFHYIYAVLNTPSFRDRFRDALRYDFARVPITRDTAVFAQVCELGADLVSLHLLEHPDIEVNLPAMQGDDHAVIHEPRFDADAQEVHLAADLVASSISQAVWSYQQGAYPVLRDFLNARRGRRLTSEEFGEFRRLAAAIRLTVERLPRLDQLLPKAAENAFKLDELRDTLFR